MKTSYFGNRAAASSVNAISIARFPGRWWRGRKCIALAPSISLLNRAKAGLPWPAYVAEYKRDVLDRLDPHEIFSQLGPDSILLCWERPGENCHRRLVAEWLEKALLISVPEF